MENTTTALKDVYDNQYKKESQLWRALGAKAKVKNILSVAKNKRYDKVIEVGAGEGSVLNLLSERSFANYYFALEISTSGLEQIYEKKIKNLTEALMFDGYKMPYPDNHFDLAILTHVLEHVEYERILLRELARVSKEQIIEVPREFRFGADKNINHFLAYGHINMYTPTGFKFLLRSEGFEIKQALLALYAKETYTFTSSSAFSKLIKTIPYWFKKFMLALPFRWTKELYCSTITVKTIHTSSLKIF